MSEIINVKTCKSCGHDNSASATRCNGCGKKLEGFFSDGYLSRWVCPTCGNLNMSDNSECLCGYKRAGSISWGWIIFIGFIIFAVISEGKL